MEPNPSNYNEHHSNDCKVTKFLQPTQPFQVPRNKYTWLPNITKPLKIWATIESMSYRRQFTVRYCTVCENWTLLYLSESRWVAAKKLLAVTLMGIIHNFMFSAPPIIGWHTTNTVDHQDFYFWTQGTDTSDRFNNYVNMYQYVTVWHLVMC